MKFAIYSRKSIYTGRGESIENQIEMCKQYIFQKFSGIADSDITIYEDEGFSGKNIDRPQFQKMLQDIRQKRFDYIVCYRLDRISRSVSDFSTLIEDLNDRDISFLCVKEEFDTSKPMGKAMMYIASVFAQLERETLAERVRDNMLMLARTGRWLGGTTPTGFTSKKVEEMVIDGKIKASCKLVQNPTEIAVVKIMFEKFLELHSISGVSKYLIKRNIKSRNGKFYSLLGIKEILQNPVYCVADPDAFAYFTKQNADVCFEEKDCSDRFGLLSYNKRDYTKKSAPRLPIECWIIAIGKHRGIVSGKEWTAVQKILEAGKPDGKTPAKMHNNYSLLSGLIYCQKCGARMFAKSRSNNKNVFDYICNSKMRGGTQLCSCPNMNGQKADDLVCEYLMQYASVNSRVYPLLENIKKELASQTKEDPITAIDRQIKKCRDEMDNLVDTLAQNNFGQVFVQRIDAKIAELEQEITDLSKERKRLAKGFDQMTDREIQMDLMARALSNLKNHFDDLTVHEKRIFIKILIQKIVWDGKNLHIFLYGE